MKPASAPKKKAIGADTEKKSKNWVKFLTGCDNEFEKVADYHYRDTRTTQFFDIIVFGILNDSIGYN